MTALCMCRRPRTGLVTSRPLGGIEGPHAATPVCDLPACIEEAIAFVERMSHKEARHIPDGGVR